MAEATGLIPGICLLAGLDGTVGVATAVLTGTTTTGAAAAATTVDSTAAAALG